MSFGVLLVCTGNIHRSAAAELLLRAHAPGGSDLVVRSAGTRGLTGAPIDPAMAEALASMGIDSAEHRARRLVDQDVLRSDLVLVAETAHRNEIVARNPAAMRKVFTLREFVRLADSLPPSARVRGANDLPTAGQLRDYIRTVAGQRGWVPAPTEAEDIADPVGQRQAVVRARAVEIAVLVDRLLLHLGLAEAADHR